MSRLEATSGSTFYFDYSDLDDVPHARVGMRYSVCRIVPVVKDTLGRSIEVRAEKMGEFEATEIRSEVVVGKHTGRAITQAMLKVGEYAILP